MSDDKINERPSRIGLVNTELDRMGPASPAATSVTQANVQRATTANWVAFANGATGAGADDLFSTLPHRHTTQDDSATSRLSPDAATSAPREPREPEMEGLDFELAIYTSLSAHPDAVSLASLLFDAASQGISARPDLRRFSPDIFDDVPDKLLHALRGCIRAPYLPEGLPAATTQRWTVALGPGGQAAESGRPGAAIEDLQPPRKRRAIGDGAQPVGGTIVNVAQGVTAAAKLPPVQHPEDLEGLDEQIEISAYGVEGRNEAMFKFLTSDPKISDANLTLKLNALSAQGHWSAVKESTVTRLCAALHTMREDPEGNGVPSRIYRLLVAHPGITREEAILELSKAGTLSKSQKIDAVRHLNLGQSAINNRYLAGTPGNSVSLLRNQATAARNLKIFQLVDANPDITVEEIRKRLGDNTSTSKTIESMAVWAKSVREHCHRGRKEATTAAGALHFLLLDEPELSFDTADAQAKLFARWKACNLKGLGNFATYRSNSLLALAHHVFERN